jgi:alkanesulfonate monooxygenase SsuD/methylene tetrahydromethanopterin reductase-like flavin-dependent oxidoreductase (luciferase family)
VKIRIGLPTAQSDPFAEGIRNAWSAAGRTGEPRLAALIYFSLGDDAEEASRRYLLDYYGFSGDVARRIADSAHRSVSQLRDVAKGSRMQDSPSCISIQRWPELTRSTALLTPYSEQQS